MKTATAIPERAIIFGGPMVRAILANRKRHTRRVIKPQPSPEHWQTIHCGWYEPTVVRKGIQEPGPPVYGFASEDEGWKSPYGAPGHHLWVRETWLELRRDHWHDYTKSRLETVTLNTPRRNGIAYRADCTSYDSDRCRIELGYEKWRSPIHMPRLYSRLSIEVVSIRVEQLQSISEEDAIAEGVDAVTMADVPRQATMTRRADFAQLWDIINGKRGYTWESNPWVWVIDFKQIKSEHHS